MTGLPPTVLADDLTGACEIAASGYRRGLRSIVALGASPLPRDAELFVIDTESRLDGPAEAAAKVARAIESLPSGDRPPLFKKIDSALRGSINAEVATLAQLQGFERILLLPANPALGRLIREGMYTVRGVPLHETEFAHDPHHPALTANVCEHLMAPGGLPVTSAALGQPLPPSGLIVGDTATEDDFRQWLPTVDGTILPAGGAAFFDVLLESWTGRSRQVTAPTPPSGPSLLISGTLSPTQRQRLQRARADGLPAEGQLTCQLDPYYLAEWESRLLPHLEKRQRALAFVEASPSGTYADPDEVRAALAELAARLVQHGRIRHLIVEGGATAAAIAERLSWKQLVVSAEWGAGTVSLHPTTAPGFTFTLKPGSYPWPEALERILFAASDPAAQP